MDIVDKVFKECERMQVKRKPCVKCYYRFKECREFSRLSNWVGWGEPEDKDLIRKRMALKKMGLWREEK